MLKRAVCFTAAMIIALLLVSYPAFAIEYEDLPPEIQEYVDEVKSSAYEEGREYGYEDGSYDEIDEEYEEEDYDDFEDEYDPFTGARRGGRDRSDDNILGMIVTVGEVVIFVGGILFFLGAMLCSWIRDGVDKIKERRKDREN